MTSLLGKLKKKLQRRGAMDVNIDWTTVVELQSYVEELLSPFKNILMSVRTQHGDGYHVSIHGVMRGVDVRKPATFETAKDIATELVRVHTAELPAMLNGKIPAGEAGKYLTVNPEGFGFIGREVQQRLPQDALWGIEEQGVDWDSALATLGGGE